LYQFSEGILPIGIKKYGTNLVFQVVLSTIIVSTENHIEYSQEACLCIISPLALPSAEGARESFKGRLD
jgi:hypothetical protein